MLSVLCKLLSEDRDEKKTQYFAKIYNRNVINTSKGRVEENPLLCTRDFLIDLLTLTQAGIKKKCGPQYANMDYRPENVYYDKETDTLGIGKQYQPGDVLTFDGATGEIISGDPLQVIVGYTEGVSNKSLGYLISEYKDGQFITSRVSELELLSKITIEGLTCCNAFAATNDNGEPFLDRKAQGFAYTIDVSDITQLKKVENLDKEALELTEKTVKLKHENKLGQMMNTASSNILAWLSEDTDGVCTKEQKDFMAEYYSWYTKRTFEFLHGSSSIKARASKIMALDSLKLSKDVEWKHIGYYTSPHRAFKCSDPSCGKALSKAHIFECNDPNVGHVKLMFGADCAEQFFDMTSDTLTCLADASAIVEAEIKNIFNIYRNNRVEEAWDEIGMFKDSILDLRKNNNLGSTYGEENEKWLSGFLDNNIPFPDSLLSTVVTGLSRASTNMKDDTREQKNDRIHKEVSLVRAKALNTVSLGQTDEEFHAISHDFWLKKEPQYSELVKYLPEANEYYDFVLRYKMYGRPLTGEALDKFNSKHKTTLRRLKQYLGVRKFNALELAQVTEMLKLQSKIALHLDELSELREVASDKQIVTEIVNKLNKDNNKEGFKLGTLVYLTAFLRPLYNKINVTGGRYGLKESLIRRRIVTSLKPRLLVPDSFYGFIRSLRQSLYDSTCYEVDYDGDRYANDSTLLERELSALKESYNDSESYVLGNLIPYLNSEYKNMRSEESKREKEIQAKVTDAKIQVNNNYKPILPYSLDDLNFLGLAYEDGIGLGLRNYRRGNYEFLSNNKVFLEIQFEVEEVRSNYKAYNVYSDGVRITVYDLITGEPVKTVKIDGMSTYYSSLRQYELSSYMVFNDQFVLVELAEPKSGMLLLQILVAKREGSIWVSTRPLQGMTELSNYITDYTPEDVVTLMNEIFVVSSESQVLFAEDRGLFAQVYTDKYRKYLENKTASASEGKESVKEYTPLHISEITGCGVDIKVESIGDSGKYLFMEYGKAFLQLSFNKREVYDKSIKQSKMCFTDEIHLKQIDVMTSETSELGGTLETTYDIDKLKEYHMSYFRLTKDSGCLEVYNEDNGWHEVLFALFILDNGLIYIMSNPVMYNKDNFANAMKYSSAKMKEICSSVNAILLGKSKGVFAQHGYSFFIEFMTDKYLTEGKNQKVDLVTLLLNLTNDYPKVVSSRQNTEYVATILSQKKKFKDLNTAQKRAVVQVICDKISANDLNKDDYDLSDAQEGMINFTKYLNKDKKLADEITKFMDAVNLGDIKLDSKTANILTSVSRSGKCSDRQKKYIDDIRVLYEQAMNDKMLKDII